MKSIEAIQILLSCQYGSSYYIEQENGIRLIKLYIKEKKDVDVDINPPDSILAFQLYDKFLATIMNYYLIE